MVTSSSAPDADLDFDNGAFDAAAFAAAALAGWQPLAAVIDHTLLKPEATQSQIENLCDEVIRYRFACAMVNPVWASTAVSILAGTGIPVGVAIGAERPGRGAWHGSRHLRHQCGRWRARQEAGPRHPGRHLCAP